MRSMLPSASGILRASAFLTVAIGCTGGQHRSVYFAEQLARRFAGRAPALVRHREIR